MRNQTVCIMYIYIAFLIYSVHCVSIVKISTDKGIPLEDIRAISCAYDQFKPVKFDEMHTVLYNVPIADHTKPPKPHKGTQLRFWNNLTT
jgi:hypothetical protein